MEQDKSKDVVDDDASDEKPIMSLFIRLISSKNKQNTVLTNAQLKEILKKEFDIDTDELHELEEDIYLNVMKKFLKDWPQWDEFDQTVTNFKVKNDYAGLNNILQIKYKSLKKYLGLMLSIAEPLARENLKKVEATPVKITKKPSTIDDIVLEVHCNRAQLNKLFYKQPHLETGSVFNIDDSPPSRITLIKPSFAGILNSFGISIGIKVRSITITRFTCHEISHVLVNRKLNIPREEKPIPNESIQMKYLMKPTEVEKRDIVDTLTGMYKKFKQKNFTEAMTVLELLIRDLAEGPNTFRNPSCYRKYMSKYPYKRYLNADLPVETEPDEKYDLTLEETICPRYQYTIHKYVHQLGTSKYCLHIECSSCGIKFKGDSLMSDLEHHYLGFHSQELDVICANCKTKFSIDYLTNKRWRHDC